MHSRQYLVAAEQGSLRVRVVAQRPHAHRQSQASKGNDDHKKEDHPSNVKLLGNLLPTPMNSVFMVCAGLHKLLS